MSAKGTFAGTPAATGTFNFTVTVTDANQLMATGNFSVTVNSQPVTITTGNLPQGQQGNSYSKLFAATGGTPPYDWSTSAGTPPPGILMSANGTFAGTPTATGTFNFAVTVSDAYQSMATANFSATIIEGSSCNTEDRYVCDCPTTVTSTVASGGFGPPNYQGLRNDCVPFTIGDIPNVWTDYLSDYGYSGAGLSAVNDGGLTVCRVTDGNTDPGYPGFGYTVNYSGSDDDEHISVDGSMFLIGRQSGQQHYVYTVPTVGACPIQMMNSGVPFTIPSKVIAASQQTPKVFYVLVPGAQQTAIQKYDLTSCTATSCIPVITPIYDWSAGDCLNGLTPSAISVFRVSNDDTMFSTSFSFSGGQDTNTLVATYRVGSGCRVYNTCPQQGTGSTTPPNNTCFQGSSQPGDTPAGALNCTATGCSAGIIPASTVVGDWGPTGTPNMTLSTFPGTGYPGPDGYKVHETYQSFSNAWMQITGLTCTDQSGTSGADSCNDDTPFDWQIGTLNFIAQSQGGHFAPGNYSIIHGTQAPQVETALTQILPSSGTLVSSIADWNIISNAGPNNMPCQPGAANSLPCVTIGTYPNSQAAYTLDMHCSWNNDNANDTNPIFCGNTTSFTLAYTATRPVPNAANNGCVIPYPLWANTATMPSCNTGNAFLGPFVNEELIEQTSTVPGGSSAQTCAGPFCAGEQSLIRPGNSYISGTSWDFSGANSIQSVSPNGLFYLVTSDWLCTLGIKNGYTTPAICGGIGWQPFHAYNAGDIMTPKVGNASNYTYQAAAKGTSCTGTSGVSPCTGEGANPAWTAATVTESTGLVWNYLGIQNMRTDVFMVWLIPPGSFPGDRNTTKTKGQVHGSRNQ
jgi:hypothetical protein